MSVFNGQRLPAEIFKIDTERMRKGWYSDAYFSNIVKILETLSEEDYVFEGKSDLQDFPEDKLAQVKNGDIVVEMQFFTRRKPYSLVAGVDEALTILKECTGYYDDMGDFVNMYHTLEIEVVEDGTFVKYDGNPMGVQPVLKVRGIYRYFALLETPILGALSEASRVATNVFNVLKAAKGKDILFFPARFVHYKMQALHGYAYSLAVQGYNEKYGKTSNTFVSTDDQGDWWGGKAGGTIAHASIAAFLGDTAETMMQFSRIMPLEVPRIALVDYHNDCLGDTLEVMKRMFNKYWSLLKEGKKEEAQKYQLFGVRPDTSGNMRDVSIPPLGDKKLDCGVNPRLIWALRNAINDAFKQWDIPFEAIQAAKEWCHAVRIVVTGGFNAKKITMFEELGVPVDIYGVGSSLLENSDETNNDYTSDIVRVKLDDTWVEVHKAGRGPCDNPNLERIQ